MVAVDHPEVEDVEPPDAHLAQVEGLKQVPVHPEHLKEGKESRLVVLNGLIGLQVELDYAHE